MRRLSDEDGAVAVIVGLSLIVLLGFAAIAVDVGDIYVERRELQNGANAGALAIAMACAEGALSCASAAVPVPVLAGEAQPYADANAKDSRSNVPRFAAHGTDPERCDPSEGALTDANPLLGANSVKVSTETIDANTGDNRIRHFFAGLLSPANEATRVTACAVASWGGIGSAQTIPLTFSTCEWDAMTGGLGADALPTPVETVYHHLGGGATTCLGPAGQNVPGGFSWLDTNGDPTCTADVDGSQWAGGDTGSGSPSPAATTGCTNAFFAGLMGETVLMPIFGPDPVSGDSIRGLGSNAEYYIVGFAALEVHGYRVGGSPSEASSPAPCGNPERCISGRFVAYYDYGSQPVAGAPNFGVVAVGLTG